MQISVFDCPVYSTRKALTRTLANFNPDLWFISWQIIDPEKHNHHTASQLNWTITKDPMQIKNEYKNKWSNSIRRKYDWYIVIKIHKEKLTCQLPWKALNGQLPVSQMSNFNVDNCVLQNLPSLIVTNWNCLTFLCSHPSTLHSSDCFILKMRSKLSQLPDTVHPYNKNSTMKIVQYNNTKQLVKL